ncbi:MAG: hypothetical protein NC336_05070 [Clostridium sp.]|nr:hypothetical protein [Clostridium sp.]
MKKTKLSPEYFSATTTLNCREIYCSRDGAVSDIQSATRDIEEDFARQLADELTADNGVCHREALAFGLTVGNPDYEEGRFPAYGWREVTLPGRSKKCWAVTRTVDAVVGYGIADCSGAETLSRTRTFTHIFIFDQIPPLASLSSIAAANLWMPRDSGEAVDGAGLEALTTDFPVVLEPRAVTIEPLPLEAVCSVDGMDRIVAGLLQARDNRLAGKETALTKLIVIMQGDRIPAVAEVLGALPGALTAGMWFQTNYSGGYSVPDSLGMVFIDETRRAELFASDYLVVDTIDGTTRNIDNENPVYRRVGEVIRQGDAGSLSLLLDWYLSAGPSSIDNPEFEADRLIALNSDRPLELSVATAGFVRRTLQSGLSDPELRRFVSKLNEMINNEIETTDSGVALIRTLAVADILRQSNPAALDISETSVAKLSRLIFARGADGYLGRLLSQENAGIVSRIIPPEMMGNRETFFAALSQSREPQVWTALICTYFRGVFSADMDFILTAVYRSTMSAGEKNKTVSDLFPLTSASTYISEIVAWYRRNPLAIAEIDGPIHNICMAAREECFSRLVGPETPREILSRIGSDVVAYFSPRIAENPNIAMEQASLMIKRMTPEVFSHLDALEIFTLYLDQVYRTPSESAIRVIDNVKRFGVRLPDKVVDRMNSLQCLLTAKEPAEVTAEVMSLALRLPELKISYLRRLERRWIDTAPPVADLREFVRQNRLSDPDLIGGLIDAVWLSESRSVEVERKNYIQTILDYAQWSSDQKKAYISGCTDTKLNALLRQTDSVVGKLFRRLRT